MMENSRMMSAQVIVFVVVTIMTVMMMLMSASFRSSDPLIIRLVMAARLCQHTRRWVIRRKQKDKEDDNITG